MFFFHPVVVLRLLVSSRRKGFASLRLTSPKGEVGKTLMFFFDVNKWTNNYHPELFNYLH